MNRFRFLLTALVALLAFLAPDAPAAENARVVKVLPHYLDARGRHSLSPSLFERDAYQERLRKEPALRHGLRFDIQFKGAPLQGKPLQFFLEVRGSKGGAARPVVIEGSVPRGGLFGNWARLTLGDDEFGQLGDVTAWRASIWRGDELVSDLKSFLW